MPTPEEMKRAADQIERLTESHYRPNGYLSYERVADAGSEGVRPWANLQTGSQWDQLVLHVDWQCFGLDQALGVIDRVLDGQERSQWMADVGRRQATPLWSERRPQTMLDAYEEERSAAAAELQQQEREYHMARPRDAREETDSVTMPTRQEMEATVARIKEPERAAPEWLTSPASSTMPDFRADVFAALMTQLEAFGDEFERLATTAEQKALAEAFGEFVAGDAHPSIAYLARGEYQVWHDAAWPENSIHDIAAGAIASVFPDDFSHVADIRAEDLQKALELTAAIKAPRDTSRGDVIVDPQGQPWRIADDRFEAIQQGTYRVWQANDLSAAQAGWSAFPQDYRPMIDISTDSRERAYALVDGGAWWEDRYVDVIADGVRTSRPGDVIVGPDGKAHRITPDGFAEIDPAKERAAKDEPPWNRAERQLRDWKHDHSTEFVPDPATGRIGPGTHRWENDAWAVMPEAGKLRVVEGVPDWSGVDDRRKEAILAREVDFSGITRDQLNSVYEEIGSDAIDERPARRLFDVANYERAAAEAKRIPFGEQMAQVRDTTRNLVESVMQGGWPRPGAIVDFGLDSQRHYEALYHAIRNGEVAPLVLDAAMGHGAKLTLLARESPGNPHKDIRFHTAWDDLLGRPPSPAKDRPLSPGDIADRKGAPSPPGHGPEQERER